MITDIRKPENKSGRHPNQGCVDVGKMLELYSKCNTRADIARYFGVNESSITRKLDKFLAIFPNPEEIQEFNEIEKHLNDGVRMKYLLHAGQDDVIKSMSGPAALTGYGILHDKRFPAKGSQVAVNIDVTLNSLIAEVQPPERFQPVQPAIDIGVVLEVDGNKDDNGS